MENKREPDPRWGEFEEVLDEQGKAIGFHLPGNEFLFRYDKDGGWQDEHGKYYNAQGALQEEEASASDEESDVDERHDDLDDDIEEMLREEEQGINRGKPKKKEEQPPVQEKKKEEGSEFSALVDRYVAKENVKTDLPSELFIYFKQRVKNYQRVQPLVEKEQSTQKKNEVIGKIREQVQAARKQLIDNNKWLNEQGVFLDFSGDSQQESVYDRYWYGFARVNHVNYLNLLSQIQKSDDFKLLQIKTLYALKSKFFPKKNAQRMQKTLQELRQKVNSVEEGKSVELSIYNLPEHYPLSLIYDLVDYTGGAWEELQSVVAFDDIEAKVVCTKQNALKLINLEGYNHDKGEFIEITVEGPHDNTPAKFYWISIDCPYKIHERQLHDTLTLPISKQGVAKHHTKQDDYNTKGIRFALGSVQALRRVLMFRGDSLNAIKVLPSVPK